MGKDRVVISRIWEIIYHSMLGKELGFISPCWYTGLGRYRPKMVSAGDVSRWCIKWFWGKTLKIFLFLKRNTAGSDEE